MNNIIKFYQMKPHIAGYIALSFLLLMLSIPASFAQTTTSSDSSADLGYFDLKGKVKTLFELEGSFKLDTNWFEKTASDHTSFGFDTTVLKKEDVIDTNHIGFEIKTLYHFNERGNFVYIENLDDRYDILWEYKDTFSYDPTGKLISRFIYKYYWDPQHQRKKENMVEVTSIRYNYDSLKRCTDSKIIEDDTTETNFFYDANGRRLKKHTISKPDLIDESWNYYFYDPAGNLIADVYKSNNNENDDSTTYKYDERGRLTEDCSTSSFGKIKRCCFYYTYNNHGYNSSMEQINNDSEKSTTIKKYIFDTHDNWIFCRESNENHSYIHDTVRKITYY